MMNFSGASHPSEGIENNAAKNVAGRKAMVKTTTVFIDVLFRQADSASSLAMFAASMLTWASLCVKKPINCPLHHRINNGSCL